MAETTAESHQIKVVAEDEVDPSDHESWRVALYYYYVDLSDAPKHVDFQILLCESLSLYGRIRVSPEGINVVLTGLHSNLQVYEQRVTEELQRLRTDPTEKVDLDLKYCLLREDLPSKQFIVSHLFVPKAAFLTVYFTSQSKLNCLIN
jgi:hypothetical protein